MVKHSPTIPQQQCPSKLPNNPSDDSGWDNDSDNT